MIAFLSRHRVSAYASRRFRDLALEIHLGLLDGVQTNNVVQDFLVPNTTLIANIAQILVLFAELL